MSDFSPTHQHLADFTVQASLFYLIYYIKSRADQEAIDCFNRPGPPPTNTPPREKNFSPGDFRREEYLNLPTSTSTPIINVVQSVQNVLCASLSDRRLLLPVRVIGPDGILAPPLCKS